MPATDGSSALHRQARRARSSGEAAELYERPRFSYPEVVVEPSR